MNAAATSGSTLYGRGGGARQWLLCSSWGLISGKISGDKVCSVFSVQCPHLSQDIHIRAANVGTGALCHRPCSVWTRQLAQFIYIN